LNWYDTQIWKELERRAQLPNFAAPNCELKRLKSALTLKMPNIEAILADGGTSRLDFTLHDSKHSFRVAERMADLMPAGLLEKLSEYELALLLLSAYLHDIGMTPAQSKILGLEELLLDGNTTKLAEGEQVSFRRWTEDANDPELASIPDGTQIVDAAATAKIRYTITHYARYRHNDWSGDWIRENFVETDSGGQRKPFALGDYEGWLDDLITLCQSHHESRSDLLTDRFKPRLAGTAGEVVHVRFLACLLRLADILEFAPWRTPDVLHKHREVDKRSVIYWRKDHVVTARIETAPHYRICIEARPSDARIHSAVETMIRDIDHELATCRFVADECHMDRLPGLTESLPHSWPWPSASHSTIRPKNDAYVFMKGTFRPNTSKLLELLSGTQLWGNPNAALRELLQNAFDAVREQLAYERLSRINQGQIPPDGQSWECFLGNNHHVSLAVEQRDGALWLCCQDDGVGMNLDIIEQHFLVSGKPVRHQIKQLERDCLKAGFSLGRTGQFGIGVLSYFMLGEEMRLLTRRSQVTGEGESNGWEFSHEGAGDWGQMTKNPWTVGTRVEIKLSGQDPDAVPILAKEWIEYLRDILVRVPCRFVFDIGDRQWRTGPGWTHDDEYWKAGILKKWTEHLALGREHDLQPIALRQHFAADDTAWDKYLREALSSLRFEASEHQLACGLGTARVVIPFFDLRGSKSLVFPFINENGRLCNARARAGLLPDGRIATAWKGMGVSLEAPELGRTYPIAITYGTKYAPNITCELDLHDGIADTLSVDRKSLQLSSGVSSVLFEELYRLTETVGSEFIAREPESIWHVLNGAVFGVMTNIHQAAIWPTKTIPNGPVELRSIDYPCVLEQDLVTSGTCQSFEIGTGNRVTVLADWKQAIASYSQASNNSVSTSYPRAFWGPTRIALSMDSDSNTGNLVRLWDHEPDESLPPLFPPTWKHVVGARFGDYKRMLNLFCPLVHVGVTSEMKVAEESINKPDDLMRLIAETKSPHDKVALLLAVISSEPRNSNQTVLWNGIIEKFPELARDVWKILSLPLDQAGNPQPLLFISKRYGTALWPNPELPTIMAFAPDGATFLDQGAGWNALRQQCLDQWIITAVP
jgi:hypothetical protein